MNEFYVLDAKYTCCGCLEVSQDLLTMSADDITWYKNNVEVDIMDNIVKICYVCRHMLHKFKMFISQCQHSSKIMKCVVEGDPDAISKYKPNSFNYVATTSVTHYFGPDLEFEVQCNDVELKTNDLDNLNNDINNINDDDLKHDDDDIPLVMLKETVKEEVGLEETVNVKKKRKRKHNDYNNQQNLKEKKVKQKKPLKEGFSSRMVQETEEYEVIKLTKEQVIKEMEEKSKSDKYLQCMYKCEKCAKGFNFKDVLENHMKKHSQENGALKCDICAQYCPSTVSLRGHMKSHTTRYKCKICGAIRISRQHLLEHYSLEHTFDASSYVCDHCPFTTKKRTVIQRHVRAHRLGKSLTCSICGAGFNNMHSLRMHATRHDPSTRYSCPQCNMQFAYPSQLHRHRRSHTRSDYYCVECDVTFKTLDNLKLHFKRAKRHRDPSTFKYKCSQCPERFISPSAVLTHLTSSHGAAKTHACPLCGKLYSSRDSVKSHERRAHGSGRVRCDVCMKEFSRKYVLTKHLRTHSVGSCDGLPPAGPKKQENIGDGIQAAKLET